FQCPLAFRDVCSDATNRVYLSIFIEEGKLVDNAGMQTVVLERHFLKFHRYACLKHLKIVGLKRSGLLLREYFLVRFAPDLFLADVQDPFKFLVDIQIAAVQILQKSQIRTVGENRAEAPY